MPHRSHLFSLELGHALKISCIDEPYSGVRLRKDFFAGITVGIIALPLAMALAIASGVPPQHGLYTAAIAGLIIALTGGSRYSISGPTAAFVVILYPITLKYGLHGLLLATMMSGVMLIVLAFLRLGRLIEYIPEPVTLGFTGGIAIVIATLQIKDFCGLPISHMPVHYMDTIRLLCANIQHTSFPSLIVAFTTLFMMVIWPKFKTGLPPHLPAVFFGSIVAFLLNSIGWSVDTISSRFSYTLPNGILAHGIPSFLPNLDWIKSQFAHITWKNIQELLPSAFAIAMLGAIESLLCAVVLDGMSNTRHSANSELLGQGIGNLIVPLFGGITATAAIARSTANIKAGAESPVAAAIHALFILFSILCIAPLLGYLPMPTSAALLVIVAWNISESPKIFKLLKNGHRADKYVLITCLLLTVTFDMVIAITAGILLSALLFVKLMAEQTKLIDVSHKKQFLFLKRYPRWSIFKITGPLFFAAADKIFAELLSRIQNSQGVILSLESVNMIDAGGISAFNRLVEFSVKHGIELVLLDTQEQPFEMFTTYQAGSHYKKVHIVEHHDGLNDKIEELYENSST